MTRELDLWESEYDDYQAGRAQDMLDHGIEPDYPEPPPENCPRHGLFPFTIWGQCPSCEDDDAAAFEASKQYDSHHFPIRRTAT